MKEESRGQCNIKNITSKLRFRIKIGNIADKSFLHKSVRDSWLCTLHGPMLFILVAAAFWTSIQATLTEFSGFHCMMRHSMRMNRVVHGNPQETPPPFEFRFMDDKGYETRYYEPGKIYTIRLTGSVHFRGLLLQGRLTNENGFLLGSLKGGRFIENENWKTFGIRMQDCNPRGSSWEDSVTHIDDSQKFIVQLEWTTDKDIGAVQFIKIFTNFLNSNFCFAQILRAKKRKSDESLTSSHYMRSVSSAKNTENFTATNRKTETDQVLSNRKDRSSVTQYIIYEKDMLQRTVPETLRDSAYHHENEVEEVDEKGWSTIVPFTTPFWESENSTATELPLIRTTAPWQLQIGKMNEIEHIYEGRFPKISTEDLNNELTETEVKMTSMTRIGKCDPNLCKRNGTCVEKSNGELGCKCPPGASGKHCEREINECNFRRCKNGAKCVDKWNDYLCICQPGWMGKDCDRPCQDIYRSCKQWKKQGQCEQMRDHTRFFDVNCALSCGQCTYSTETVRTIKPLAPVLLPLAWMIGIWKAEVNGTRSRTVDYVANFEGMSYTEILAITVADVLMFGKPSINFTSIAINRNDTTDQHIHYGFLTVGPNPDGKPLVALVTSSNLGEEIKLEFLNLVISPLLKCSYDADANFCEESCDLLGSGQGVHALELCTYDENVNRQIMIEEGEVNSNSIQFTPVYRSVLSYTAKNLSVELHRTFSRNNERLIQSLTKKDADGRNRSISKRYDKIDPSVAHRLIHGPILLRYLQHYSHP
ncbi:hypothetical protein X798_05972 [Onchocerca flexuosa]|uniref:EGF-like domain protein n=1 Tax=Onchocerca flexuosa TaxID=387005 RepID=A0A238BQV9_9BILA|nr:hypothetical protein X798_05972 [Onchocerca flexuosa]